MTATSLTLALSVLAPMSGAPVPVGAPARVLLPSACSTLDVSFSGDVTVLTMGGGPPGPYTLQLGLVVTQPFNVAVPSTGSMPITVTVPDGTTRVAVSTRFVLAATGPTAYDVQLTVKTVGAISALEVPVAGTLCLLVA